MSLRVQTTRVDGVLLVYPQVFRDERGFFQELWSQASFREAGLPDLFVQDNFSCSRPGVLRGLHYQVQRPQGKLVRVTRGRVLDVAVDLRRGSATFGQHVTVELSGDNHAMLWIPPGLAHGFRVLGGEPADMHYKCTDAYCPEGERTIRWDDPDIAIDWGLEDEPLLSDKDRRGTAFSQAELFDSPVL